MSTQYRLVQSGKTASGGCSAGQGSSEPVAPRISFPFTPMSASVLSPLSFPDKMYDLKQLHPYSIFSRDWDDSSYNT
jgi:hypothetical protein